MTQEEELESMTPRGMGYTDAQLVYLTERVKTFQHDPVSHRHWLTEGWKYDAPIFVDYMRPLLKSIIETFVAFHPRQKRLLEPFLESGSATAHKEEKTLKTPLESLVRPIGGLK